MKMTVGEEACVLFPALIGEFNFANLAAAFLVMRALGYELLDIAAKVSSLQVPEGRMQSVGAFLPQVIVDFAHTPDAIRVVLNALKPIAVAKGGRLLVLFGCGGDRDRGKRPLMATEVQQVADVAVVTTDNARSENVEAIYLDIAQGFSDGSGCQLLRCDDRAEAIKKISHCAEDADIVAILGKGHEKYQEIAGQRTPFDDVKVAREVLQKKIMSTEAMRTKVTDNNLELNNLELKN
jgi:UDP-N-acetylmuramoyl-L-alanyl-D-glutamate--2,6-diaminopimelate ligase